MRVLVLHSISTVACTLQYFQLYSEPNILYTYSLYLRKCFGFSHLSSFSYLSSPLTSQIAGPTWLRCDAWLCWFYDLVPGPSLDSWLLCHGLYLGVLLRHTHVSHFTDVPQETLQIPLWSD